LLSYAVNLFILSMGRLKVNAPAVVKAGDMIDPTAFADPVPQALVLTAIVISFATTALFLVVLLASRGLTGPTMSTEGARTMIPAPEHLVIAPIVVPLVAGALLLFFDDRKRRLKATASVVAVVVLLAVSISLLRIAHAGEGRVAVYLLGNWPPPFAIVLVLDRLSAMMLALTAALALPALIFSLARWHKAGPHFHTLLLFLLVGLNGACLTGDLFNLFVFFEVMLAASYGLVLHGSGPFRVGWHAHIAMNLAASLLFLIGVSLIYGVTGTLNMADLAQHIPNVPEENRMMLEAGAAVLGIAFLMKAGMWPLSFGCRAPTRQRPPRLRPHSPL
jgi:multicomponent K+:H+ antiporter subunit D